MGLNQLKVNYKNHYSKYMGSFEFLYSEVSFEVMNDFSEWKMSAYHDGKEKIVIFYQED